MRNPTRRPSVSIDEAIGLLIGWIDGPVVFECQSDRPTAAEMEALEGLTFDIFEALTDAEEDLRSDIAEARLDDPAIEEIKQALEANRKLLVQAETLKLAIHDDLGKGAASALHVDHDPPSTLTTYITLLSLDDWARANFKKSILDDSMRPAALSLSEDGAPSKDRRQGAKQREQEGAILSIIKSLGHDPMKLPTNEPGKAGIKARVRDHLDGKPPFDAATAFEKAWERLRKNSRICDA